MELTIIIPVFNGGRFFKESLKNLEVWLKKHNNRFELIVVNDGSSDNTLRVLENFKKQIPNYLILDLKENRGKGFAIKEGMKRASGDYIGFTDADLPYGLEVFDQMLNVMRANPDLSFLHGSRHHALSRSKKGYGFIRSIGRLFFSHTIRLLAVPNIPDTQCGIKMFKRDFVEVALQKSIIDRFAFDIELFVIAKMNNLTYQDFPVELSHRRESSVRLVKDTLLVLKDVLRIRARKQKYVCYKRV